jgi:hypothetical protein
MSKVIPSVTSGDLVEVQVVINSTLRPGLQVRVARALQMIGSYADRGQRLTGEFTDYVYTNEVSVVET